MIKIIVLLFILPACLGYLFPHKLSTILDQRMSFTAIASRIPQSPLQFSSNNADMFGTSSTTAAVDEIKTETSSDNSKSSASTSVQSERLLTEAQKLRKEASDLEVALREEARAKGLPEELINKLVPLTNNQPKPAKDTKSQQSTEGKFESEQKISKEPMEKIRKRLGYLSPGDAVKFTTDLDRLKVSGGLSLWNSVVLPTNTFNSVNEFQLQSKSNIDPKKLKLDDVGYDYQNVLVAALVIGTTMGLGSSFIGGQLGFFLGYASALIPITLVGVGSIAPALIGDVLFQVRCAIDEDIRKKYVANQAAKFLVGYLLGMPLSRFDTGKPTNISEYFQIRPETLKATETAETSKNLMFAIRKYSQAQIAASSVICLAGSVAECLLFQEATGHSAADVNTLTGLMGNVEEPKPLTQEQAQGHVRWAALNAFVILSARKELLEKLIGAFSEELPLEECIALIESA